MTIKRWQECLQAGKFPDGTPYWTPDLSIAKLVTRCFFGWSDTPADEQHRLRHGWVFRTRREALAHACFMREVVAHTLARDPAEWVEALGGRVVDLGDDVAEGPWKGE